MLVRAIESLYAANTPEAFWRLLIEPEVSQEEWEAAIQAASSILPKNDGSAKPAGAAVIASVLGEEVFGSARWRLGVSKRLYYQVKPVLPRWLGILARRRYRRQQETQFALGWPVEDRYVRFQFNCVAHVLHQRGLARAPYVNFWPDGCRAALVLTHDVEGEQGHDFVERIADLEESLGFRSSFNFVPERYPVDRGLLEALRQRGFEVGVHGLNHDGKLFASRRIFEQRAAKINGYLQTWGAVGFRAPYMHRNATWLQALNIEYDLSFFDTDPYEPMAGGTMSIWPFLLGSFVELPYTLVQDHTLMVILGAETPQVWLEKVDFIERWHGMALVNVHPDYLRTPERLAVYEAFLQAMKGRANYWQALPREAARWWRERAQFRIQKRGGEWDLSGLPGASVTYIEGLEEMGEGVDTSAPGTIMKVNDQYRTGHSERSEGSRRPTREILSPAKDDQKVPILFVKNHHRSLQRPGVGAVVVGGCFQGLGIVRSLGRHKVPICVIDDEHSIARFSRYTTQAVQVESLRDERETVDVVLEVGKRLGLEGWVLYPTRDETVAAFSRYRSELAERFRVPTPGWDTVRWAWDKSNTYRLAEELGIPAPRTWYPQNLDELEGIEANLPLVIKPSIKEHFIYATRAKAWRANTRAELRERFRQAMEVVGPGEVMIQELIPGDGRQQFSYCAFFKEGSAVGSMVARRLRQHPPEFGRASTYVETIDLPALETPSERILKAIDYYGLVEVEYKLDARDGQYKLLDINARTWGYHSLGQRAGVDFPYLLFSDQVGEKEDEVWRAKAGVKWMRLITDVPTAAVEFIHGHLDWRDYLRSLKDVDIEAAFGLEDPLPGLLEVALVPYLAVKRGF